MVKRTRNIVRLKVTVEKIEGFALPYKATGKIRNLRIVGNGETRASAESAVRLWAREKGVQ